MADEVVTVTIVMNAQNAIAISVDKEPVNLVNVGTNEGVQWVIDQNSVGWTFTKDNSGDSNGIDIKGAGNKFKDKKSGTPPHKKHKWERKIKDGNWYRYTISVTNETVANPATKLTWDPSIMNN
jgi:hypothetical protein